MHKRELEKKYFRCAMKMKKETRKKWHARKNVLMEGSGL